MKQIALDLMKEYKYLSNLLSWKGKLLFTETKADIENNDYLQTLHLLDPNTKEEKPIGAQQKRIPAFKVGDEVLVIEKTDSKLVETKFMKLLEDGSKEEAFTLPLAVDSLRALNESYYVVEATIQKDCPDYHLLSEDEKKAYHDSKKKEEDYLILDEYPFFLNGAGFINGTRTALFLVDRNTLAITRIGNPTLNIESLEVDGDKIYFVGNDYESMKTMFANIYCYDANTKQLEELYHNESAFISRVIVAHHKPYALAAFDTCISGQSFYEVKDKDLVLVAKTEWMFYNSVGSDCRYGKTHGVLAHEGDVYLITTDQERSIVVKFDGKEVSVVTDGEGSVDDMAFVGSQLYTIAMKNMKLQEVYQADGFVQLTTLNEEVLQDKYVAQPERFTCFNVDEIVGWALKPIDFDENKTYPMILDIHGGPKTAYGEVFYHEMQIWASLGYFVIFCNPHCSDGKGDAFANYIKHYGAPIMMILWRLWMKH